MILTCILLKKQKPAYKVLLTASLSCGLCGQLKGKVAKASKLPIQTLATGCKNVYLHDYNVYLHDYSTKLNLINTL